jgi:hypothetical protein
MRFNEYRANLALQPAPAVPAPRMQPEQPQSVAAQPAAPVAFIIPARRCAICCARHSGARC